MKITVTRSFSRTKQVAAFEPINAFCSASAELEFEHGDDFPFHEKGKADAELMEMALRLDEFVRSEVEKTIDDELARRKSPSPIQSSAKAEADPNTEQLDHIIDNEAAKKTGGYRAI